MPTSTCETSCYLVRSGNRAMIIDAGTGVRRLLQEPGYLEGVDLLEVYLSHFHIDHTVGLCYLPGLPKAISVRIWGPGKLCYQASTGDILRSIVGPPFLSVDLGDTGWEIRELPGGPADLCGLGCEMRVQTLHPQPSVALRIGDLFAYCTDTGKDVGNASFARHVRLLAHEGWALQDGDPYHSSVSEAAEIAAVAQVGELALVHLQAGVNRESARLEAARRFAATSVPVDLDQLLSGGRSGDG
ncbi:MBL fold metallo-hydrolase [Modestobacter sp. URMC 112]